MQIMANETQHFTRDHKWHTFGNTAQTVLTIGPSGGEQNGANCSPKKIWIIFFQKKMKRTSLNGSSLPRPWVRRWRWTVAGRNRVAAAVGPSEQLAPPWPVTARSDWLSVEQLTHAQTAKATGCGARPLSSLLSLFSFSIRSSAHTDTHRPHSTHTHTHTETRLTDTHTHTHTPAVDFGCGGLWCRVSSQSVPPDQQTNLQLIWFFKLFNLFEWFKF